MTRGTVTLRVLLNAWNTYSEYPETLGRPERAQTTRSVEGTTNALGSSDRPLPYPAYESLRGK